MRFYTILILLLLCRFAATAQPVPVDTKLLRDYYIIDQSAIKKQANFFVITERKQMDKLFGTTTRPDTPDFSRQWVLLLVLPESKKESKLSFDKISMKAGNFMEVYCKIDRNYRTNTYTSNSIAIAVIPKNPNTEYVKFYNQEGMRLLETIELNQRKR